MGNTRGNCFPAFDISPLDAHAVVDTETRMTPSHKFSDQFGCDFSLLLQKLENFCPKDVFKWLEVCLPHDIKCSRIPEKSVGNNCMKVGMKFVGILAKGMNGYHNTGKPVLQANYFSQKG